MATDPLSSEDLLNALQKLETPEFERIVTRLIVLKAERTAPHLPQRETELLLEINQGLPGDVARRYRELIAKRRAETLTPREHEELMRLTDQAENLEAERLTHLAELARLRHTSLTALMEELGIQAAPDA
jgi:hypothetical protein